MTAYVDPELCIGCGLCAGLCPDVFKMNEDGLAEAVSRPDADNEDDAAQARESCPVCAITVED